MNFISIFDTNFFCKQSFKIMKLSFLLIFVSLLQLSAGVFSQNTMVPLDVNKQYSVKDLFQTIEDNTSFRFFYNADLTDLNKMVAVKQQDMQVNELLDLILAETSVSYKMLENNMIVVAPKEILKQGITVTGTITDKDGPMPGVNISVKGSIVGVVSDVNGKYTITVPSREDVLLFSFVGYEMQQFFVGDRKVIDVAMSESAHVIEEVVVVGYGTAKKENLTGAVAMLSGETLENRSVSNMAQALQGTIGNLNILPLASSDPGSFENSGGSPGASFQINIRGITGFTSDQHGQARMEGPLIVIDGVQGGDINAINMNDVESIVVLKDAASSAIYGSSAPFGVILITTKKGGLGRKPTITYNNNFKFNKPISRPKGMNSLDFVQAYNEIFDNAGRVRIFGSAQIERITQYMAGELENETIADIESDTYLGATGAHANNDWFKIHFKDWSFSQQHNLGIAGGSSNSEYYIGLGYNDQEGMYRYGNDSYSRYNIRTRTSSHITKWLTFGFRGAFTRELRDTPYTYPEITGGNLLHQIARKWPTTPLKNPDGIFSNASDVLMLRDGGRNKTTTDNGILTGEIILRPLKGWDITANYTFNSTYLNRTEHLKTLYHTRPSGIVVPRATTTINRLSRRTENNQHQIINLFTTYEKQLSDHYFKAMMGFTQELFNNLRITASNNLLYSDNVLSLSAMYGTSVNAGDLGQQLAVRGTFGRVNYNYKEKYLIELNGRYDGTSKFLKDVRYRFYPGVSGGWTVSKESFWEPLQQWFNFFKIRASYGSQGSQGFTGYYPFYQALQTVRPISTSPFNNWIFPTGTSPYVGPPTNLVDPSLRWVTTTTTNYAADFGFLSNRLTLGFDWYKRAAYDYVGNAEAVPAIMGVTAPQANNASMETTGFELMVGWKQQVKDFYYGITGNLSDFRSVIVKYPNPSKMFVRSNSYPMWYDGQVLGEIWGYETVGILKTEEDIASMVPQTLLAPGREWRIGDIQYADLDGDGEISWGENTVDNPGDRRIIGNTTPRYSFGVTLTAEYKKLIDVSVFIQGVGMRSSPANHIGGITTYANLFWGIPRGGDEYQAMLYEIHKDRWSDEYNSNKDPYFPRLYMSDENRKNTEEQTRYLQNAAYMRIKNMQVGFSLPPKYLQKIYFQKLRIFLNVENLTTFTKMIKTMDPEFSTSDGKVYPLQSIWAFGVNVTL